MAGLGYNTVLLEYQDKFPFTGSLKIISAPDALTRERVSAFDPLCKELGIPRDTAANLLAAFDALEKQGKVLLMPLYTAFSMESDTASRIGIHRAYLQKFI